MVSFLFVRVLIFLAAQRRSHYHKCCGMPSVARWLYHVPSCEESRKLNGALISASRQTARTSRVSYYSGRSLFMSQFWVSVEIYLFLQAVSSEKHLYGATGSLFFFLLHRKDWETSETVRGRFAESLILPGATWLTEAFLSGTLTY